MNRYTFDFGPQIAITLQAEKDQLLRVDLSLAVAYTTVWEGNPSPTLKSNIMDWIKAYGNKRSCPQLPLLLDTLPPFQQKILKALQQVPFGTTLSYQQLASRAGNAKASRAAGTACGKNPYPLFIPCHRIVHTSGTLGGFLFGLPVKKALLEFEGVL